MCLSLSCGGWDGLIGVVGSSGVFCLGWGVISNGLDIGTYIPAGIVERLESVVTG